ncbi:MAG: ATP-binding protein [Gammaproteobacteria bacterium]|nr:ATP-binding protein [Gammaproteobacteria bacterium]
MTELSTTPTTRADAAIDSSFTWNVPRFLNIYRLLLAGLLFAFSLPEMHLEPFGEFAPRLFAALSAFYLVFAVTCGFALLWRWPPLRHQVLIQVLIDIAAITLLMHASGGVDSGLGILLLVVVAAGSLFMPGRIAIFFAAVAALSTLGAAAYMDWQTPGTPSNYTLAGILGASYFATAILTQYFARSASASENLAAQRATDLANMQQLTEYIIDRMQTGIMVLDADGTVRLMNESAAHMFGLARPAAAYPLTDINPDLARQYQAWKNDRHSTTQTIRSVNVPADIQPRFAQLGTDTTSGVLVFLEDVSAISQQAQHLKLASLGKLAASIAHEIRNPLGAISHAGQLLSESASLTAEDVRLTDIVCDQSLRVNKIISNVLQIGRRDRTQQTDIALKSWLEEFITQLAHTHNLTDDDIVVEYGDRDIPVHMDPGQLHQVLWNLCENGLRHSDPSRQPRLTLICAPGSKTAAPHIDVINVGAPITADAAQHIFEPFFTTEQSGTGLGLYIARELCELNQARLNYIRTPEGSCFRITFADHRRKPLM